METGDKWYSYCDGSSSVKQRIIKLQYHGLLNAILAVTNENSIDIHDAISGEVLQTAIKG